MSAAPTSRAQWLTQRELSAVAEAPAVGARWGEDAADTQQSSLLIDQAAAQAEAARQLAELLGFAHAIDVVRASGDLSDLTGETIEVDYALRLDTGGAMAAAPELGLTGPTPFLVIAAAYDPAADATELRGLVRLG